MSPAKVVEETKSVCPECFKQGKINKIDAFLVQENGKIYMEKTCPQHGEFKSILFEDAQVYHQWMRYKVTGQGPTNVQIKSGLSPEDQLYTKHRSQTVLTNLMLTNRCNLRCSYCFMNAGAAGYVYEPSLGQLKEMMRQVREERPVSSKAIQLTGGEPTIRDDLMEIIRMAKEMGFLHIQLNTNGLKLAESVEYCRKIKQAGVKTIYLSFDGVSKKTNPWIQQNKRAVCNLREAGITSIVLVPVAMRNNLDELAEIVKYAANNVDVVRGVNFQPISFCGRPQNVSEDFRTKERTDYVTMIEALEEGLEGQIKKEDFYPVSFVYPISKLLELLKGQEQVEFTANPMCGGATYAFVEEGRLIPITRFVDVEGLMEFIKQQSEKSGYLKKARIGASFLRNISRFVDKEKAPSGLSISKLLKETITGGTYESLKEFQYSSLYIGSMWFQDIWNLNLERLKRCVVHYSTPEGIIPFCVYNGLGVGDKIREKYGIPIKQWEKQTGKKLKDDLWKGGPLS